MVTMQYCSLMISHLQVCFNVRNKVFYDELGSKSGYMNELMKTSLVVSKQRILQNLLNIEASVHRF